MYSFKYHKARSVADAAGVLEQDPEARALAGGQSLLGMMKLRLARPSRLVDLGGLTNLSGIHVESAGVTVGAMTRHAQIAVCGELKTAIPALASLAGGIGDRMVRNMGTLGGSVANNDPAADCPAALLALDATVTTNRRTISSGDFFLGMYETALQPGEIITAVTFKVPRRAAYMKFKNFSSRFAIVGVFIADFGSTVRVAVTGARACVFRVPEMERALASKFSPESIAHIKVPEADLNSDMYARPDYRSHLITVMATRAVEAAS